MEFKDARAGGPPDNPPPYSVVPPGPTTFATSPPGPPSFSAPPPGPGPYTAPPPQGQTHVYVTAPPRAVIRTVVVQQMGPVPANIVCKSCNHQIVTRVETSPTIRTHLFAIILCLIGCWPFACVPYCVDSCNNANHYCPNCNSYIGSYMN